MPRHDGGGKTNYQSIGPHPYEVATGTGDEDPTPESGSQGGSGLIMDVKNMNPPRRTDMDAKSAT